VLNLLKSTYFFNLIPMGLKENPSKNLSSKSNKMLVYLILQS